MVNGMLNMNRFLSALRGKEVVVKLKIGVIKCIIDEVGNEGSLKISKIKIIEDYKENLKEWENRDNVVIRKDSIVAIFVE